MALPSSGSVSTSDLELEFSGLGLSKNFNDYLDVINSTTKNTNQFYSKGKPRIIGLEIAGYNGSTVDFEASVDGGNISNCQFRIELSEDLNFNPLKGYTNYTTITGAGDLFGSITSVFDDIDYYVRVKAVFGKNGVYTITGGYTIFNPLEY